jgi:hypothetical protein
MAYHSSVGCDLGGDQPTGYATPSACFHTPEITITHREATPAKADQSMVISLLFVNALRVNGHVE